MSKFEKNLSEGSVTRQLITFSLPFLISNIIQALYSVADMVIVGQFGGASSMERMYSMSGANIGGQVTMLITNLVIGLSNGGSVLIGQYLGAGQRRNLKETVGTLFTTLIVLAFVMTIGMVILRNPILKMIQTPQESFSEASVYLLVTSLGTVFIFGYNALSAVMRGMGDSTRPLIFVAIACVINVGLDLLLVAGLGLRALGAAIATVASQAISMLLCIIYLRKNDFVFDFGIKSFGFVKERLVMLLKIGIPTSVQHVVVGISFLILTAMVNRLGVTESAAVGAIGKFNSFGILPAAAMSASISAMSAQNIGANEEKRAVKTMRVGMLIAFSISAAIFALSQLFPEYIISIFADEKSMIPKGIEYLRVFSFDYLFVPIVFCFNGLFIGSGHTTFSLINGLMSSVLIRVPAAYILGISLDLGLTGVGLGAPLASFVSLVAGICFFLSGRWRKLTILSEERN